jgi:hypothetical protein
LLDVGDQCLKWLAVAGRRWTSLDVPERREGSSWTSLDVARVRLDVAKLPWSVVERRVGRDVHPRVFLGFLFAKKMF